MLKRHLAMLMYTILATLPLAGLAQEQAPTEAQDKDVRSAQVIEPELDRRNIKIPHIKAKDLADRLAEAFGGGSSRGGGDSGSGAPSLMPGSSPPRLSP